MLSGENFRYVTIISTVTVSLSQCAKYPMLFKTQELNKLMLFNIFADIIKYFPVKLIQWYYFFVFSFIYKMFYIQIWKEKYAILMLVVYISMFCINQFSNMAEKGCIWWDWDAVVAISVFTSVNTRLQLLSKCRLLTAKSQSARGTFHQPAFMAWVAVFVKRVCPVHLVDGYGYNPGQWWWE